MINKFPHLNLLLKRLVWIYVLFTLCRLGFLAANWTTFSKQPSILIAQAIIGGIWFDSSSIAYLFSPVILLHCIPLSIRNKNSYQNLLKLCYFISATLALFSNLIDTVYFKFSGKRSGMEVLAIQGNGNISIGVYLVDYWFLALVLLAGLIGLWNLYPKAKTTAPKQNSKTIAVETFFGLILLGFTGFAARGSLGLKPLNSLDAAKVAGPELAAVTLNTPFQVLHTLNQSGVEMVTYFKEDELPLHYSPILEITPATSAKNVVLIIVESLGKEYVGFYNNGIGYTPFLDSLAQHSTVYTHAYANGKRSIEGIPAIVAGMPSWLPGDYINSYYQTNTLHSIGYYFGQSGYDVSFYHGGKNGTMSFDRFIQQTQAGKYFGLNEYPNKSDFDGNWGIPDKPYLSYVGKELTAKKEPFFSTIFTLSSHHPYQLPQTENGKYKGGPLPIHATIEYTDDALRQFFTYAKTQPWYSNTVFILTADHSSENTQPYYLSLQGKYEVPLFVMEPNQKPQIIEHTVSHLSLLPLALRYLGKPLTCFSLSSNYAMQYENGLYQSIRYPFVLHFDGTNATAFYDLRSDSLMKTNLLNGAKVDSLTEPYNQALLATKAIIQTYNKRLINNTTHE